MYAVCCTHSPLAGHAIYNFALYILYAHICKQVYVYVCMNYSYCMYT